MEKIFPISKHPINGLVRSVSDHNKQSSFFRPVVQPKLTVNQPNDVYEQEADAVAEKVMRMSEIGSQHQPFFQPAVAPLQRKCAHCEGEEKQLQRKEKNDAGAATDRELASYVDGLPGSGQPLSNEIRSFFEPRMGQDFSSVRVHTGSVAAKSARSINALAYTTGNHIVFNSGQFSPDTGSGKRLLGHELTHVVQQKSGRVPAVQRMLACPAQLNAQDPVPTGWKPYHGNSCVFHCCYRGILEDRIPSTSDPQNECFYDETGRLVDQNHPYSGCRGTPDYYDSESSPIGHIFLDPGGIVHAGLPAFLESMRHSNRDWGTRRRPFPDGTWHDESGRMHMGPGPKW